MKKILCFILCITIACACMSSCYSVGVQNNVSGVAETINSELVGCWILESKIFQRSYEDGTYDNEEVLDVYKDRYGDVFQLFSNGEGIRRQFMGGDDTIFTWYAEDGILVFVYSLSFNEIYSYSTEGNKLIIKDVGYFAVESVGGNSSAVYKAEHEYVFFKSDVNLHESIDKYYFNAES